MYIKIKGYESDETTDKAYTLLTSRHSVNYDILLFDAILMLNSISYYISLKAPFIEIYVPGKFKKVLFYNIKDIKEFKLVYTKLMLVLEDGSEVYISSCANKPITNNYLSHANKYIRDNKNSYSKTNIIKTLSGPIEIDQINKRVKMTSIGVNLAFSDIRSYEMIVDNQSVLKADWKPALIGGAFLGGFGLLMGAAFGNKKTKTFVENVTLQINTRDIRNPIINLVLNKEKIPTTSAEYKNLDKQLRQLVSTFEIILESSK